MTAEEIVSRQRKRPFKGLRIYISDGQSYDITHPELMFVTRTIVHIALPPLDLHGIPTGGSGYVAPVHITRIEPLNGKRRPSRRSRWT